MALPNITLAQFNAISNGEYNAGQIDFKTGRNGETELVKINNHVIKKSQNNVVLSPERILEVKETFLNALRSAGVSPEKMEEIRDRLGIPSELNVRVGKEQRAGILTARFMPLTRAQVRSIIDEYANEGRGFTEESRTAITYEDWAKGQAAANMGRKNAIKRDAVNAESLQRHAKEGAFNFSVTDVLSVLSASRSLSDLDAARSRRVSGDNAENERAMKREELAAGFTALFSAALKMLPANVRESGEFTLFGENVNIVKGEDGSLSAILGKGELKTKASLGLDVDTLVTQLIARGVEDREALGTLAVKGLLGKVYDRDISAGLVASERTSLTRKFAALAISIVSSDRNTGEIVDVDAIVKGNYNTGLLVDIAEKALAGEDVGTKAKLDAYHERLVRDTAGLPPEIKEMLEQVANVPIEKMEEGEGEFIVRRPIAANVNEVAPVPQQPAAPPPANLREIGGASAIKDFVADLVFSDETMVADVLASRPGEAMRKMLSTDARLLAFSEIVKSRNVIDTAVSEEIRDVVKAGFEKMVGILDGAWRASHDGETIADAATRPDFLEKFSAFVRSAEQLPNEKLLQFDSAIQTMAIDGCEKIQSYINRVFKVDVSKANVAGSLVNEPYKDMKPEKIKEYLEAKSLNQILDTASNSDSPGQVGFFRQVLSTYFTSLGTADKRSCFAAAMRYARDFDFGGKHGKELESANADANNKFTGAILKGTSPLLQKMMQGLPKDVMGEFSDALEDMKCNLAPMPRKVVQAHLMKLIDESGGKIKSIELEKSLGAASVGEAFLCKIAHEVHRPKIRLTTDEEQKAGMGNWTEVRDNNGNVVYEDVVETSKVVIKIMRHDAERRMKAEADIFTTAAKKIGPGMAKTWEGQLKQYEMEFDFRIEARNVEEGVEIYDIADGKNPELEAIADNVHSMKLSPIVPAKKDIIVAEVANGDTADRFFKNSIAEVREAASGVFEQDPETGRIKWQDGPVDAETGKPTKVPVFKQSFKIGSVAHLIQWVASDYSRLETIQKHLLQATKAWFHEALFGSGKFHGDTHAGNLMVAIAGVTFIDFGNLYELKTHYELDERGQRVKEMVPVEYEDGEVEMVERDKVLLDERHELLRIMTGAAFRDKNFILKGFERLLSESGKATLKANRAKAEAILDAVLAKGKFSYDIVYRLNAAVSELQKLGIELPPQISCFIQSMARLANTVTEMNTIMKQYKSILDAANGYLRPNAVPPERDELDEVGKAFDFFGTAPAKIMVSNDMFPFNGLPEKISIFHNYVRNSQPGDEYREKVFDRLAGVEDPKAEAERLVEMLAKHLDANRNVKDTIVKEGVDRALDDFRREIDAACGDAAKKTRAIGKFAKAYLDKGVKPTFKNVAEALRFAGISRINPPKTFASAIVNLMLDNFDAVQEAFTPAEGLKVVFDAKMISVKELKQGALTGKREILAAMKRDATQTAADTDTSSYRIDIGV